MTIVGIITLLLGEILALELYYVSNSSLSSDSRLLSLLSPDGSLSLLDTDTGQIRVIIHRSHMVSREENQLA